MPRSDIPVITPYNPLDKRNLAESVASAMLHTPVQKLPPEPFIGAGVYAIYYKGDFEPYRKLVELNQDGWNVPIYVGKAVPAGARKGGFGVNVDTVKLLQIVFQNISLLFQKHPILMKMTLYAAFW